MEKNESAILADDTGNAVAGSLDEIGRPRRSALAVVELPTELAVLRPGHERRPVGRTQGEHARPHAGRSGRLDFRSKRRGTSVVHAGEINLPLRGPDCHESLLLAIDGEIAHGAGVCHPRRVADSRPRHPAMLLIPEDEIHVPLIICLLAIEHRQHAVLAVGVLVVQQLQGLNRVSNSANGSNVAPLSCEMLA